MRNECFKESTMAIMVDMQERLMPAMAHKDDITANTKILLQGLKLLEVPVLISQQYTKGLGMTLPELTEACGHSDYLDKISYSCMKDEAMAAAVKEKNPHTVFIFGVEAHICVLQTALDLKDMGYNVYVVCNCSDSRKEEDRSFAFRRMEQAGVVLTTVESCLFELLKAAGTAEFKAISRLIK